MVTVYRALFWLMLAVATQQTLTPLPLGVFQSKPDLLLHFICWASLSFVLFFAIRIRNKYPQRLVLLYLFSVALEFAQYWVPGRTFDVRDMVANATGCLVAYGATLLWGRFVSPKVLKQS